MKKTILPKELYDEPDLADLPVWKIADRFGLNLTYNRYPDISDQEVAVWRSMPESGRRSMNAYKLYFLSFCINEAMKMSRMKHEEGVSDCEWDRYRRLKEGEDRNNLEFVRIGDRECRVLNTRTNRFFDLDLGIDRVV